MECLAAEYPEEAGESGASSQKLRSLNLSYTSYVCSTTRLSFDDGADREDKEKKTDYADQIVQSLCRVIEKSASLLHLDLSGMNLHDKIIPILQSIKSAEHQTLVSVHLHDNGFTSELKDYIMKKMGIETANYH